MRVLAISILVLCFLVGTVTLHQQGASWADGEAKPWDAYYGADMDALRVNEAQFLKDHNSYKIEKPEAISRRLSHTNVLELDLYPKGHGDWYVMHDPNPAGKPSLSQYLSALADWRKDHADHPLLIINVDFKTDWTAGSGKGQFETLVRKHFPDTVLFRPKDLRGKHDDCRTAARVDGWPKLENLRGRVMFVMTGGAWKRHNQHLASYVKEEIIPDYEGVAFVAPNIDDKDDIYPPGSNPAGDLDAINKEKNHVVIFNAKWKNRDKFHVGSIQNQGLLLHFWDVSASKDYSSAVEDYKASIIGLKEHPEDISAANRTGQRGRKIAQPTLYVTFYEDDNGWQGKGSSMKLTVGSYDNKAKKAGVRKLPKGWNDEVRAVKVPAGLTVTMHDNDSFGTGGKGKVTIRGPRTVNVKDVASDKGLAGKISSIKVSKTP